MLLRVVRFKERLYTLIILDKPFDPPRAGRKIVKSLEIVRKGAVGNSLLDFHVPRLSTGANPSSRITKDVNGCVFTGVHDP